MKIKTCSAVILLFICSIQIVFAQDKTLPKQNKILVCSDCGFPLKGKPIFLPVPEYPKAAKAVRASGVVQVLVTIDENGNVIEAKAISGNPLLHATAIKSALQGKFEPILLSGKPIRVSGVIVYNFNLDEPTPPKQQEESKQTEVKDSGKIVDLASGNVIGKAIKLPKPTTPFCNCRFGKVKSITSVLVQVEIDEQGNVSGATAISGHPILKVTSENAAQNSKFAPSLVSGERVKAKATIVYKFLIVNKWSVKFASVKVKYIQIENQAAN